MKVLKLSNEAGVPCDTFQVKNWQDIIPQDEMDIFNQLDDIMKKLYDKATSEVISNAEMKKYADAIKKAKIEQRKIIWRYDFQRFVDDVFGKTREDEEETILQDKVTTPWFHIQMYNAFQQAKRVCVVCPRGHGKSSASRLYILHQILFLLARYIIIIGSSEDMAGQNMRWIRDQLTDNPIIIETFGDLSSKKKWAETDFETSTNIKVSAKGAGQKLRGVNEKGRPDLIYIDDIEDDESVRNKENRLHLAKWFKEAILPIKSKNGRFIMTGTILDMDSLLKNVALNTYRDHIKWKVLWFQAIYLDDKNKEKALWPEMKPLEELRALRENDPQTFAQEYQNNPVSGQQMVFNIEWFEWFDKREIVKHENGSVSVRGNLVTTMLSTDLAISEREGADFTVLGVSGMDSKGNIYWLDIMRFRSSDIFDIIDEIFKLIDVWNIDYATVETVAFQKTLKKYLEREMDIRKKHFHIEEMTRAKTTKMARFKALTAPLKKGKLFFQEEYRPYIELEFLRCTSTKLPPHDDFMDVISDGYEKQYEFKEHTLKEEPEVNTFEWADKMGLIPKVTFNNSRKRKGVR